MGLRTWKRKNYTVEMVDFDYDLKAFEIRQGDKVQTIYPADIEEMELIIADLDAGEDVAGWEDGLGNMIVIDGRNNIITIKIEEEEKMKMVKVKQCHVWAKEQLEKLIYTDEELYDEFYDYLTSKGIDEDAFIMTYVEGIRLGQVDGKYLSILDYFLENASLEEETKD